MYILVRSIKHRATSESIKIHSNSKIEIGMNFEDVNNIIDRKNIFEESEIEVFKDYKNLSAGIIIR